MNEERIALNQFINETRKSGNVRAYRRGQAIWWSHYGQRPVSWISAKLRVSQRIIWKWFKLYREKGLEGLKGKYFSHKL
jgi:transposase